ncbi:MAG: HTH domain-containing protein [Candidatus Helarchaeota archaeon]|nr:HTH domain-containing protein [Candidatus Helarchaeota archaeon]
MAEGSLDNTRVNIGNTSYELIKVFKELVKQNFQIERMSEWDIDSNPENRKKYYYCQVSSVELAKFLGKYIDKSDYKNVKLPAEMFNLSEANIGKVLQIVFSAEGSVNLLPIKTRYGRPNSIYREYNRKEPIPVKEATLNSFERAIEQIEPGIKRNIFDNLLKQIKENKFTNLTQIAKSLNISNTTVYKNIKKMSSNEQLSKLAKLYDQKRIEYQITHNRWKIARSVTLTCTSPSLRRQWRQLIECLGIKCHTSGKNIEISSKENIFKFKEKIDFLDGISIRKNSHWEKYTRREVLDALIESYKYPIIRFNSKEAALKFLKSLVKRN